MLYQLSYTHHPTSGADYSPSVDSRRVDSEGWYAWQDSNLRPTA